MKTLIKITFGYREYLTTDAAEAENFYNFLSLGSEESYNIETRDNYQGPAINYIAAIN